MGNVAALLCSCGMEKERVIVLMSDGQVLKLDHTVRVAQLMLQHPHHFVCHASAVLMRSKCKMLSPKANLQRGKIYLLLPLPDHIPDSCSSLVPYSGAANPSEKDPLLRSHVSSSGSTKFIISKQYLERILAEKSSMAKIGGKGSATVKKVPRTLQQQSNQKQRQHNQKQKQQGLTRKKSSITWSPALESIPEIPAKYY